MAIQGESIVDKPAVLQFGNLWPSTKQAGKWYWYSSLTDNLKHFTLPTTFMVFRLFMQHFNPVSTASLEAPISLIVLQLFIALGNCLKPLFIINH